MKPNSSTQATHGISLAKAEKAAENVRVLVTIVAPKPSMATAPSGSGCVMMPAMVPRKIASRCQAEVVTPAGGGMNHTAAARPTQVASFLRSAPHLMPAELEDFFWQQVMCKQDHPRL